MKKIIMLSSALLFAGAIGLKAQSTDKGGVHFGLRAGANLSNMVKSDDADVTTGSKVGFNAAFFVELPLASVFSIQPELQFSQKGFKATGTALGAPYEYKQTTNFIEVPVLAKIKPIPGFGIVVGPQFSFLASTKTNFTTNNLAYENIVKEENDNLRKNIFGGVIGIEAGAKSFVASLRYNMDFQNNNGDGTSSTPRYKNQVIALGLGIVF
jgi:Outer membrane protein beta-barrel domain